MRNKWPINPTDIPDNKILVLGQSPGFAGSPEVSKTIQRVKGWMIQCGIQEQEYDWRNCVDVPGAKVKMKDVALNRFEVANYEKVICLGISASKWCERLKIKHIKVPHPSGLNRQWNDPSVEPNVINNINSYLVR